MANSKSLANTLFTNALVSCVLKRELTCFINSSLFELRINRCLSWSGESAR